MNRWFLTTMTCVAMLSTGCATTDRTSSEDEVALLAQQQRKIVESIAMARSNSRGNWVKSGDTITIEVWMADRKTQLDGFPLEQIVGSAGEVFVPSVGLIKVAGRTDLEIRTELLERVSKILRTPAVMVRHKAPGHTRARLDWIQHVDHVTVLGWVEKPGLYEHVPGSTVRDAIALAGGLKHYANKRKVLIVRGDPTKQQVIEVDIGKVQVGEDLGQNMLLDPSDSIYVPASKVWRTSDFIRTILLPITAIRDAVWVYDRVSGNE